MPVAETASTFNENIIMNAVIDETEDKEVKLYFTTKPRANNPPKAYGQL